MRTRSATTPSRHSQSRRSYELEPWSNGTLVGIQPQTFTCWVNEAARKAGFPPGRKRRAHTLRATFAPLLAHEGDQAAAGSKLDMGMFFPEPES
jgi:hypothetical protein